MDGLTSELVPWVALLLSLILHVLRGGKWVGRAEATTESLHEWRDEVCRRLEMIDGFVQWKASSEEDRRRLWQRVEVTHDKHTAAEQQIREDLLLLLDRVEARLKEAIGALDVRINRCQQQIKHGDK